MADDVLFELRNKFLLGDYPGCINEADNVSTRNESDKLEKDCYVYRSYIAQGDYKLVLDEIKKSANPTLQMVRQLALYMSSESNRADVLDVVKENVADGTVANNQLIQLIVGIIYAQEGATEDALKCLHASGSLEGLALLIQMYIKIDRVDLAEKELKNMNKMDADATITQLATAWVYTALGGEKIQEAFHIFKELSDKYGVSVALLNAQAVCNIQLQKYEDAEAFLIEATGKNSKDPDTIANLITCYLFMKKPVDRYVSQLKTNFPQHPWVVAVKAAEESFDRASNRFAI
eukprot:TRINITY_DN668_c0_g1_i1.p1 TRINITY_DN668_c0_g1~~TRINITY_DN668_c0_g1_i1.p1  ORF type:complete len:291 (-),score=81.46 TRINITY_DN668_c0_g1_i1:58-930(-)